MTKYQVSVVSIPAQILPLLKSLRLVGRAELREAKERLEYLSTALPCILVAGIDRDVADHIIGTLEEAGAVARVEESSINFPMLLHPQANQRHKWHWLTGSTAM